MRRLINRIRRAIVRNQIISISQQLADLPADVADIQQRIDARAATDTNNLQLQHDYWREHLSAEQKRLALLLSDLGADARRINGHNATVIEAQP